VCGRRDNDPDILILDIRWSLGPLKELMSLLSALLLHSEIAMSSHSVNASVTLPHSNFLSRHKHRLIECLKNYSTKNSYRITELSLT
jgi:hypothetical protein